MKNPRLNGQKIFMTTAAAIMFAAACCVFDISAFAQSTSHGSSAGAIQTFGHILEQYISAILTAAVSILESFGAIVIIYSSLKSFVLYWMNRPHVRLTFAQGMAMGLEFKLAGEILRTVIVRSWDEIFIVGAIILLRAALNFLIHWEIKQETAHMKIQEKHTN